MLKIIWDYYYPKNRFPKCTIKKPGIFTRLICTIMGHKWADLNLSPHIYNPVKKKNVPQMTQECKRCQLWRGVLYFIDKIGKRY